MQLYTTTDTGDLVSNDSGEVYLASEADALIAKLREALREAMGWNWLDEDNPPPQEVRDQCNSALMG